MSVNGKNDHFPDPSLVLRYCLYVAHDDGGDDGDDHDDSYGRDGDGDDDIFEGVLGEGVVEEEGNSWTRLHH